MAQAVITQPNIKIARSKFKGLSHSITFTAEHGVAVPFECMEVLPGDTMSMVLKKFIKMGNPIVPIMDNIQANFDMFYVPFSIIFDNFKKFWGENPNGKGFANLDNSIEIPWTQSYPSREMDAQGEPQAETTGTIGDYLGIVSDKGSIGEVSTKPKVSKLPGMAYLKIINRWYLNREMQEPFVLNQESNTASLGKRLVNGEEKIFTYNDKPVRVNKMADLFTRATESAQAGDAVFLPLGDIAPVIPGDEHKIPQHTVTFKQPNGQPLYTNDNIMALNTDDKLTTKLYDASEPALNQKEIVPVNLWADLTQATGIEWNQLRLSGALQRYKEKQIQGGSLYYDWLLTHFGVKAPNLLIQEPELLSHNGVEINVAPIYQTYSNETGTSNTSLGQPGAISNTRQDDYCFTKAFVEPGLIMCIFSTKHKRTYPQGIKKLYTKLHPTDFYIPEFAFIGPQAIKKKELFVSNNPEIDESTFGFQEAWAEMRNERNRVAGEVNPANKGANPLWTLADKFTAAPVIGDEFLQEDELEIDRCLTTTGLAMPYYVQVYMDITAIRPIPTYSIPSLSGWY